MAGSDNSQGCHIGQYRPINTIVGKTNILIVALPRCNWRVYRVYPLRYTCQKLRCTLVVHLNATFLQFDMYSTFVTVVLVVYTFDYTLPAGVPQ